MPAQRVTSPAPLVLDLRSVSFMDCTGLGVLCHARKRVLARKDRLRLVSDNAGILGLLRLTGLRDVFEVLTQLPQQTPAPVASPQP
ncbi:anti-sigma factor antagonist [Streptomyces sp. NPDC127172]|uniref:anti-sigma factor antagonist n=1 Tax=Streptomyces sp. NPDC127172 TaxID=3345382 RepID=UPI00363F94FA